MLNVPGDAKVRKQINMELQLFQKVVFWSRFGLRILIQLKSIHPDFRTEIPL